MGEKPTLRRDVALSPANWKTVSGLAKEGIESRGIMAGLKEKISAFLHKITGLKKRLQSYESRGVTEEM